MDSGEHEQREPPLCERIELLKVPIDIVSEEALEEVIGRLLREGGGKNIVLLSLADLMRGRSRREYRPFVRNAALVIPISKSLVRGGKFLTGKSAVRYMPFDFIIRLLDILEQREGTLYLLGGAPHILRVTEKKIHATFPRLRVVGRFPATFRRGEEPVLTEAIRKAAPSLLLVGKGVPGGEKWLARAESRLNPGLRLWCSDVYEVFAERRRRPSRAFFDRGLEWLGFCFHRPLYIFRVFLFIYYNILLLIYKLRKKS